MLLICSSAWANDEPVPGHILLDELPEGSRILVKQSISLDKSRNSEYFRKTLHGKSSQLQSDKDRTFQAGEVHLISESYLRTERMFVIRLAPKNSIDSAIYLSHYDSELPRTVSDFNGWMGDYFQIIYDAPDPYPGMEKSMVVDIVMGKITAALKANDYAKALPHFVFLEKQAVPLPESFYYYYTETLEKTGKKSDARIHASDYLKRYGKKGKYYSQVIALMARL